MALQLCLGTTFANKCGVATVDHGLLTTPEYLVAQGPVWHRTSLLWFLCSLLLVDLRICLLSMRLLLLGSLSTRHLLLQVIINNKYSYSLPPTAATTYYASNKRQILVAFLPRMATTSYMDPPLQAFVSVEVLHCSAYNLLVVGTATIHLGHNCRNEQWRQFLHLFPASNPVPLKSTVFRGPRFYPSTLRHNWQSDA